MNNINEFETHLEIKKYFALISLEQPDFLIPYLNTKTMTRLKGVEYLCGMSFASKAVYNFKYYLSRYDHSISTALMIWRFTKDKKQTLAALFHDAGTPTFAHVIDYLNNDLVHQESTEINLNDVFKKDKELLELFKRDGFDYQEIIDYKNYPLVDNKRPKLCADRLDGIFITSLVWARNTSLDEIKDIIKAIELVENEDGNLEFSIKELKIAERLIELNNIINELTHSDEDYFCMNQMAKIIQRLINNEIIKYDDLYDLMDFELIEIIKDNIIEDKILANLFKDFVGIKEVPSQEKLPIKERIIDPLVNGIRYSKI